MLVRGIIQEDFVNYKKPSMFLIAPYCDFKCEYEIGIACCQNSSLTKEEIHDVPDQRIVTEYLKNPITKAIVIGGLEPFTRFYDVLNFVQELRRQCENDVVIYTGYYPYEVENYITELKKFKNIIIKFGRYVPNDKKKYDDVLGVYLASRNQYAERIS